MFLFSLLRDLLCRHKHREAVCKGVDICHDCGILLESKPGKEVGDELA